MPLEASRNAVFTQRMLGSGMGDQSSERPRRTTYALVKAAKTMALAARRTISPVKEARRDAPQSRPPPPPPHPPRSGGAGGPLMMSEVMVPGMTLRRVGLHDVVFFGPGHAI